MSGKPETRHANLTRSALYLTWAAALAFIPALSYFGRRAQRFVLQYMDRSDLTLVFGALTLLLAGAVAWWLVRRRGWRVLVHLVWIAAACAAIFASIPPGERWLHVPLFGFFGFLSVRLFGLAYGLIVALSVALLDEIWQHFLPDRFGSPIDVAINAASAGMGALLADIGARAVRSRPVA